MTTTRFWQQIQAKIDEAMAGHLLDTAVPLVVFLANLPTSLTMLRFTLMEKSNKPSPPLNIRHAQ
ncbi:MAG: hypothetical protein R3D55_27810 [Chloroflexota bacterium]